MSADTIGWIATLVYLARLLPQPVRLARTGVPDGVSPLAAMNASISNLAWVAYGLVAGLAPVWVVAAIALVLYGWTVSLLRRRIVRNDVLVAGAWLAIASVAWGFGALGAVLALAVIVNQGPQVVEAVRSSDLRGIAPATWWIAIADATLWGGYGIAAGDPALMGYGAILLPAALTILVRIWWTGRGDLSEAPAADVPAVALEPA